MLGVTPKGIEKKPASDKGYNGEGNNEVLDILGRNVMIKFQNLMAMAIKRRKEIVMARVIAIMAVIIK